MHQRTTSTMTASGGAGPMRPSLLRSHTVGRWRDEDVSISVFAASYLYRRREGARTSRLRGGARGPGPVIVKQRSNIFSAESVMFASPVARDTNRANRSVFASFVYATETKRLEDFSEVCE